MKKKICFFVFFGLAFLGFQFTEVDAVKLDLSQNISEPIDISTGWEIINFHSNQSGITVDEVFKQGHVNEALNQKMALVNFANIGDATLSAKKEIVMKKDHIYSVNVVYAMLYTSGTGYIDFNGIRFESDSNHLDKIYSTVIKPTEDMIYHIELGFNVNLNSNGYVKLGYDLDNQGGIFPVKSKIISEYIDMQGNTLSPPNIQEGEVGSLYKTSKLDIKGYSFKEQSGDTEGVFKENDQNVVFKYEKNDISKFSTVIVHYIDEKGSKLVEDVVLNGKVGDKYQTEEKNIKGYIFKEVEGEQIGEFTDRPQEVSYKYTEELVKAAPVTVRYLDENGNQLIENIILNGTVGEIYKAEEKKIEGYTLKEVKGIPLGKFMDEGQEVIYVFKKSTVSLVSTPIEQSKNKEQTLNLPETGEKNKSFIDMGVLLLLISLVIFLKIKFFVNEKL